MAEDKKTKRARAAMKDMGTVTKGDRTPRNPYGDTRSDVGFYAERTKAPPRKYKDKKQGKFRMSTVAEPRKAVKGMGKMRSLDKVLGSSTYGESDHNYDLTRQIAHKMASKDAKKATKYGEERGDKPGKIDMKKMKKPVEYVKAAQAGRDEMIAAKKKFLAKKITQGQYDDVLRKYGYGPRSGHYDARRDPRETTFPERRGHDKFDRKESRKRQIRREKEDKQAKARAVLKRMKANRSK